VHQALIGLVAEAQGAAASSGMGWPLEKYTALSIQPVRSAHGNTWNVAGWGTRMTAGNPVNSSIPKPPPAAKAGTNTWSPGSGL
jgi:hypothetical protein